MSKGYFVKDGTPVYFGTRADKPRLEADHEWVPNDDPRVPDLRAIMNTEPARVPQPTLQDLIDELATADAELKTRLQVRVDIRK